MAAPASEAAASLRTASAAGLPPDVCPDSGCVGADGGEPGFSAGAGGAQPELGLETEAGETESGEAGDAVEETEAGEAGDAVEEAEAGEAEAGEARDFGGVEGTGTKRTRVPGARRAGWAAAGSKRGASVVPMRRHPPGVSRG